MQVHRPDFAALIAALEANLPPEPKRAPLVTPPRPPSRSFAQQARDLAEDDRITHALLAPPMKLVFKEPAYIPDFARPVGVVIGIDLGSGDETVVATLAPSSAVPAGWTNSRNVEPASPGWYEVEGIEGEKWAAYYFGIGLGWSNDIEASASMESKADALEDRFEQMDWRGPRLIGADWPEPPTTEVPLMGQEEFKLTVLDWLHGQDDSGEARSRAKALLAEFGAKKLTDLAQSAYPQFLSRLAIR